MRLPCLRGVVLFCVAHVQRWSPHRRCHPQISGGHYVLSLINDGGNVTISAYDTKTSKSCVHVVPASK